MTTNTEGGFEMEDAYTQHGFELLRKMRQMDDDLMSRILAHDAWVVAHKAEHGRRFNAHTAAMRFVHPNNQRRRFNGR